MQSFQDSITYTVRTSHSTNDDDSTTVLMSRVLQAHYTHQVSCRYLYLMVLHNQFEDGLFDETHY